MSERSEGYRVHLEKALAADGLEKKTFIFDRLSRSLSLR